MATPEVGEVCQREVDVRFQCVWAVESAGALVALDGIFLFRSDVVRVGVCWSAEDYVWGGGGDVENAWRGGGEG